ncbi:MAG: hypothetical protein LC126_00265 [Bryobacterales bacterium]|nr:hypothetical protein [Bryobacterales bacterium]
MRNHIGPLVGVLLIGAVQPALADSIRLRSGAILRAVTAEGVRPPVKPGVAVLAEFASPVYSRDRVAIPPGSKLKLTIGDPVAHKGPSPLRRAALMMAGRTPQFHHPNDASVRSAELQLPSGTALPLDVDLVDLFPDSPVRPKKGRAPRTPKRACVIVRLKAPIDVPESAPLPAYTGETAPAGASLRVMLLSPLSASGNSNGDTVRARLLQPLLVDGRVALPEGTELEASMARRKPPRSFSRSGSFGLNFRKAISQGGLSWDISADLSGAVASRGGMHIDPEGAISGGSRSKKRAVIDLGVAYVAGKIVDDLVEEGIKAIWTTASSGTVAGAARWFGLGTGAFLFFLQQGRDVYLPQYSELTVTLNRPLVLGAASIKP